MTRYRDETGRVWLLIRKLPFGSLELFDEVKKRFMTVNSTNARRMVRVIENDGREG